MQWQAKGPFRDGWDRARERWMPGATGSGTASFLTVLKLREPVSLRQWFLVSLRKAPFVSFEKVMSDRIRFWRFVFLLFATQEKETYVASLPGNSSP